MKVIVDSGYEQDMANTMKRQWHDWRMRDALSRYEEGELPPAQAQRLEQHLEVCAACSRKLREVENAERRLRQHIPVQNALAPQSAQNMFRAARIKAESQAQRNRLAVRRRRMGALAGACACIGIWLAHGKIALRGVSANSGIPVTVAVPLPESAHPGIIPHFAPFSVAAQNLDSRRKIAATTRPGFRRKHSPTYKHRRHELRLVAVRRTFAPIRFVTDAEKINENVGGTAIDAQTDSAENFSLLTQQARGMGPESHLLVTVTHAAEEQPVITTGEIAPSSSHNLPIPMKSLSACDGVPGVATVSALGMDDTGTQIWRVCSVAQNMQGMTTVRCAAAWQNGRQPISSLAVTTETVEGDKR